jgi:hypothetical protein
MKRILLAVDGMAPDRKALHYALTLCNPVRAGLDVLQIIRPFGRSGRFGKLKDGVRRARDAFEKAMVTAAFAEAGAPELAGTLEREALKRFNRILPARVDTSVDYHCVVTGEDPDSVLKRYVDEHRNIILAVYDSLRAGSKVAPGATSRRALFPGLLNNLTIPLVLVRDLHP